MGAGVMGAGLSLLGARAHFLASPAQNLAARWLVGARPALLGARAHFLASPAQNLTARLLVGAGLALLGARAHFLASLAHFSAVARDSKRKFLPEGHLYRRELACFPAPAPGYSPPDAYSSRDATFPGAHQLVSRRQRRDFPRRAPIHPGTRLLPARISLFPGASAGFFPAGRLFLPEGHLSRRKLACFPAPAPGFSPPGAYSSRNAFSPGAS